MTSKNRPRLTTKGVVVLGLLGALMFGARVVMAPLPNIEPVSLPVMVYTVVFGLQALFFGLSKKPTLHSADAGTLPFARIA